MRNIKVGGKIIGAKDTCFMIAEAGVNHNCKLSIGKELIKKAAKAGADAIKFQNYSAEKLVTRKAPRFWKWAGEKKKQGTQYDSYSLIDDLPKEDYRKMVKCCKENDILFMSTPFDEENADFLEDLGVQLYKLASCDITNTPFIKYVSRKKKPIILSTGTSNIAEISEALDAVYSTGNDQVVLLHCTLCYPTLFKDANLRMMETMMKVFPDIPVGLSDHTLGTAVPLAAVALGAKIIEKHYTINKKLMKSADHWLSVDDKELHEMVTAKDQILAAMGIPEKKKVPCEEPAFKYARRSLVAEKFIPTGARIDKTMLAIKRPGTGVSPKYYDVFLGKKALRDIQADSLLEWADITS